MAELSCAPWIPPQACWVRKRQQQQVSPRQPAPETTKTFEFEPKNDSFRSNFDVKKWNSKLETTVICWKGSWKKQPCNRDSENDESFTRTLGRRRVLHSALP